jgi:hypothetical protein
MSIFSILADIGDFIGKIAQLFTAIGQIARGLGEIVYGVGREFVEAPAGVALAWVQLVIFIQTLWVFAITNFNCAMKMMNNATYCAFFYILDVLGQMIYLIPRLVIYVLSLLGLPAYDWEKRIWDFLEEVDMWMIDHVGIHIIHFPKSIRNTCFNCRRLKPTAFISKATKAADTLRNPIIPLLTNGLFSMKTGLERIASALDFQ